MTLTPPIRAGNIDLGGGFSYRFFRWAPDRRLTANHRHRDHPNIEKAGITLWHGPRAIGACWFDLPDVRAIPTFQQENRQFWQLHSLDPLHLEPSIQTYSYTPGPPGQPGTFTPEYHGYIREGRWIPA